MIRSFADSETERFFYTGRTRRFAAIASVARRKLEVLDNAFELADLREPPGNRLEMLRGDRAGRYSIRINGQHRICFHWNGEPEDVEITDYH